MDNNSKKALENRRSQVLTIASYLELARRQEKPWAIETFVSGMSLNEIELVEFLPAGLKTEQRMAAEDALRKEVQMLTRRLELCRAAERLQQARSGQSATADVLAVKRHLSNAQARPEAIGITAEALDSLRRTRHTAVARTR